MANNPRNANGSARRKLRLRLRSLGNPCWICRAFGRAGDIDYSLPSGHPYAFEVDELIPVSKGGNPLDFANVAAAHRCCNQWRGNKDVAEVMALGRLVRERRLTMLTTPAKGGDTCSREW